MDEREPSRTAMAAAAHRAAHQLLEAGRLFSDPLAVAILGEGAEAIVADAEAHPGRRPMRFFIAARSHFAEAMVDRGIVERGVTQVVVLGAGLDTFAYRHRHGPALRVFEVDHPATQVWKRRRLTEAGIDATGMLRFVPVDFERDALLAELVAADFDPTRRTAFLWLGVVPYLTEAAIRMTLATIGGLPGGAEVVFDYADPPSTLSADDQRRHSARAERVAALGEPWRSYLDAPTVASWLRTVGLTTVDDLGPAGIAERYWPHARRDGPDRGGHLVFAATPIGLRSS